MRFLGILNKRKIIKYFAYGSNMNPELMRERNINFSLRKRVILRYFRLEFNKIASRNPKEGYANIVPEGIQSSMQESWH